MDGSVFQHDIEPKHYRQQMSGSRRSTLSMEWPLSTENLWREPKLWVAKRQQSSLV